MFLQPAPGRVVPDPERSDLLPAQGRDVPASTYWLRRVADGDVVMVDLSQKPVNQKAKA